MRSIPYWFFYESKTQGLLVSLIVVNSILEIRLWLKCRFCYVRSTRYFFCELVKHCFIDKEITVLSKTPHVSVYQNSADLINPVFYLSFFLWFKKFLLAGLVGLTAVCCAGHSQRGSYKCTVSFYVKTTY